MRKLRILRRALSIVVHELLLLVGSRELRVGAAVRYLLLRFRFEIGRAPKTARLRVADTRLLLGPESFGADLIVFAEIFVHGEYHGLPVRGAHVLDLGAHKGYFGAWALRHGAARVSSYEPEPRNFAALVTAIGEGRTTWCAREEAVGAFTRPGLLRLDASWTHALTSDARAGEVVPVEITGIPDVLARARSKPAAALVVKLDVEGAEAEILHQSSVETFHGIDAMAVEIHEEGLDGVAIAALRPSGLELTRRHGGVLVFSRSPYDSR